MIAVASEYPIFLEGSKGRYSAHTTRLQSSTCVQESSYELPLEGLRGDPLPQPVVEHCTEVGQAVDAQQLGMLGEASRGRGRKTKQFYRGKFAHPCDRDRGQRDGLSGLAFESAQVDKRLNHWIIFVYKQTHIKYKQRGNWRRGKEKKYILKNLKKYIFISNGTKK